MDWTKRGIGFAVGLALGLLVCGSLACGPLFAGVDPAKDKDIRKLLRVSGIYQQLDYMRQGVLDTYGSVIASAYPKVPQAFWDEYYRIIGEKEMKSLIDRVVPVYDKHMSHEVIKKLIAMFENPFWEEWKKKMPLISREAGQAGSDWSQELVQSDQFKNKVDALIKKYELETLNPESSETPPGSN